MKQKIKSCILYYVDEDEKTYNPGLILTDPDVEDEICKGTMELREQGRNVRIFTAHLVDDINHLPSMHRVLNNGLMGYRYDPFLIW